MLFTKNNLSRALIFFIGFIVVAKIALVFFLYTNKFPVSPIQDPLEFRNLALNILEGRFSSAQEEPFVPELYRTPAYPLFLSATFLLDKNGYLAIFAQQLMLFTVAYLLFLLITKFIPQSKNIALFITMLLLVDLRVWFWSLETMSETLFMFFAVVSVFLLLWRDEFLLKYIALSALFFGMALLTRPSGLLWLPGILALIFLSHVRFDTHSILANLQSLFSKRKIMLAFFFLFIVLATVAPWLARNYQLVGEPILSSSPVLSYAYAFGGKEAEGLTQSCLNILFDAKGREGCHIYGFTTIAFAPLTAFVADIKKDIPLSLFLEKNITGAFRIWTITDYRDILSIGLKNVGLESNTSLSNFFYRTYSVFLTIVGFLAILGIAFLVKEKRWNMAAMIVAVLLCNTIITYNLAYGRHHITLLPILLFSASFGVYFLTILCGSYSMLIRKVFYKEGAVRYDDSQNTDY